MKKNLKQITLFFLFISITLYSPQLEAGFGFTKNSLLKTCALLLITPVLLFKAPKPAQADTNFVINNETKAKITILENKIPGLKQAAVKELELGETFSLLEAWRLYANLLEDPTEQDRLSESLYPTGNAEYLQTRLYIIDQMNALYALLNKSTFVILEHDTETISEEFNEQRKLYYDKVAAAQTDDEFDKIQKEQLKFIRNFRAQHQSLFFTKEGFSLAQQLVKAYFDLDVGSAIPNSAEHQELLEELNLFLEDLVYRSPAFQNAKESDQITLCYGLAKTYAFLVHPRHIKKLFNHPDHKFLLDFLDNKIKVTGVSDAIKSELAFFRQLPKFIELNPKSQTTNYLASGTLNAYTSRVAWNITLEGYIDIYPYYFAAFNSQTIQTGLHLVRIYSKQPLDQAKIVPLINLTGNDTYTNFSLYLPNDSTEILLYTAPDGNVVQLPIIGTYSVPSENDATSFIFLSLDGKPLRGILLKEKILFLAKKIQSNGSELGSIEQIYIDHTLKNLRISSLSDEQITEQLKKSLEVKEQMQKKILEIYLDILARPPSVEELLKIHTALIQSPENNPLSVLGDSLRNSDEFLLRPFQLYTQGKLSKFERQYLLSVLLKKNPTISPEEAITQLNMIRSSLKNLFIQYMQVQSIKPMTDEELNAFIDDLYSRCTNQSDITKQGIERLDKLK